MSDGALKDYKFSQKNNWRWWLWKTIAKRVNPKTARCLVMPGSSCNDIFNMISLKFRPENIVALERDEQVAAKIRRTFGILTIPLDVTEFLDSELRMRLARFDVIALDFCGGLTESNWRAISHAHYWLNDWGVLGWNVLRGRDGHSSGVKHRGAKGLVAFSSPEFTKYQPFLRFVRPKLKSYNSGNLRYDSCVVSIRDTINDLSGEDIDRELRKAQREAEDAHAARLQAIKQAHPDCERAMQKKRQARKRRDSKHVAVLAAAKAVRTRTLH